MNCMTGETAAFPDEAAFFGEEAGNFAGDQFVGYGGTCSRMFSWISAEMGRGILVGVDDSPGTTSIGIVV